MRTMKRMNIFTGLTVSLAAVLMLFLALCLCPAPAQAAGEALAAPVPVATAGAWTPGAPWDYKTFREAMRQSGRASDLPEKDFNELQARKGVAVQAIEKYLVRRFGKADPSVLRAFRELPREYYHYDYQQKRAFASNTYEPAPKPWAIGYGPVGLPGPGLHDPALPAQAGRHGA